jgi:hypothetical protein
MIKNSLILVLNVDVGSSVWLFTVLIRLRMDLRNVISLLRYIFVHLRPGEVRWLLCTLAIINGDTKFLRKLLSRVCPYVGKHPRRLLQGDL